MKRLFSKGECKEGGTAHGSVNRAREAGAPMGPLGGESFLKALDTMQDDFQKRQAILEGRLRQAEGQEQGRRHQLLGVLPLPRRVTPRPSEDLASVIVRTAQAMRYSEPGWILRHEKVAHAVAPGELALLRRRLDIDEATLYRLTLHRFAMRVQGTWVPAALLEICPGAPVSPPPRLAAGFLPCLPEAHSRTPSPAEYLPSPPRSISGS